MVTKLLWLELMTAAALAVLLLAFPTLVVRILGLPPAGSTFWPRMLGGGLAGIAFATLATGMEWTASGLGLGGHIAINLTVAFTLIAMLSLGPGISTRRGRLFGWIAAAVLVLLALVELAYVKA